MDRKASTAARARLDISNGTQTLLPAYDARDPLRRARISEGVPTASADPLNPLGMGEVNGSEVPDKGDKAPPADTGKKKGKAKPEAKPVAGTVQAPTEPVEPQEGDTPAQAAAKEQGEPVTDLEALNAPADGQD